MVSGISIGYVYFTTILMLLTGLLILRIDTKMYQAGNQKRETKVSQFMGWFNIVAGAGTYLGYWLYQKLIW